MSVSTFGTFTTARLGIYAAQKAMEVTGNNISNINTTGYTRQILNQKSLYVGGTDKYAPANKLTIGSGVLCTSVSQLRDPYLDIRYRTELSNSGAMDAKLAGLEQLSSIFDEVGGGDDGEGVIEAQLNDLIEQLNNLATQGAGNSEYDSLVRSSAASLVALFNTYADQLNTLKENQTTSYKQDIEVVNGILSSIQTLNSTIYTSQLHGSPALELQDQRNMLIDTLSQYVKIDVSYEQTKLITDNTVEKLTIKLSGSNTVLVDGNYATQFSITSTVTDNPAYDANDPNSLPYLDADGNPTGDINAATVYDPKLGITLSELTNLKGAVLAGSTAVDLGDTDLYGSLQSTREILTEEGEFSSADDIANDPNATTKRGIPYYQNALDSLANKLATVLNEANTLSDDVICKTDADGNFLDIDGNITTDPTQYVRKPEYEHYNGGSLFSNNGNGNDTTNITASNISISKDWSVGEVKILQSKKAQEIEQTTDNSNLLNMLYLLQSGEHSFTPGDIEAGQDSSSAGTAFYKGTIQGMFTNISATLANDYKSTLTMLETYTTSAESLYVDRDSVSGVDLNDETMGMMQYQKAYTASCRLLTTVDEMIDKLINGTGRAGI